MAFRVHIGMRKIKSLLAVILSFGIWQLLRVFTPMLEPHPIFAYIYSIIEMRESPDKTKNYGKLRIKATLVGLFVGLVFVAVSCFFACRIHAETARTFAEFLFILAAVLCSLTLAELTGCADFCGVAAAVTMICMVSYNETNIYTYAIMRVIQTLIGVFSAMLINVCVGRIRQKSTAEKEDP